MVGDGRVGLRDGSADARISSRSVSSSARQPWRRRTSTRCRRRRARRRRTRARDRFDDGAPGAANPRRSGGEAVRRLRLPSRLRRRLRSRSSRRPSSARARRPPPSSCSRSPAAASSPPVASSFGTDSPGPVVPRARTESRLLRQPSPDAAIPHVERRYVPQEICWGMRRDSCERRSWSVETGIMKLCSASFFA